MKLKKSLSNNSLANDATVNNFLLHLHFWVGLWVGHVWLWCVHSTTAASHLTPWEAEGDEEAGSHEESEDAEDDEPSDTIAGDDDVEGTKAEL